MANVWGGGGGENIHVNGALIEQKKLASKMEHTDVHYAAKKYPGTWVD